MHFRLLLPTFAVASRRSTCCPSGTLEREKARFESYTGESSNVVKTELLLNQALKCRTSRMP